MAERVIRQASAICAMCSSGASSVWLRSCRSACKRVSSRAIHTQSGGIPRRINTLCSRVLLLGSLEETQTITAEMVDTTANELNEDLGAGGVSMPEPQAPTPAYAQPVAAPSREIDSLAGRIMLLEQGALRQERMLKRLLEIMEARVPQ
jgi:general secretion pathway protein A